MTTIVTVTMNPSIDISTSVARVTPIVKLRCTTVQRDPGGGGINVARVVKRFSTDCAALYPAGGSPGHELHRLVDLEGILSIPVETAAVTRENFTVFDDASGEQYRFVLPGPTLTDDEWGACLDRLASLSDRPDYVVASGSLPPGVPDDFHARAAKTAKSQGARMVVDTSGAALAAALDEGVYLVKPNLRELRDLTGRPLTTESEWCEAARQLVTDGRAQIVALSLGEDGALLATADQMFRAPALPVKIASAVGAGDSFVGAMVWALESGRDVADAFRYGVAAGTAALLTPGTELCRRPDVDRLYGDVRLRSL